MKYKVLKETKINDTVVNPGDIVEINEMVDLDKSSINSGDNSLTITISKKEKNIVKNKIHNLEIYDFNDWLVRNKWSQDLEFEKNINIICNVSGNKIYYNILISKEHFTHKFKLFKYLYRIKLFTAINVTQVLSKYVDIMPEAESTIIKELMAKAKEEHDKNRHL